MSRVSKKRIKRKRRLRIKKVVILLSLALFIVTCFNLTLWSKLKTDDYAIMEEAKPKKSIATLFSGFRKDKQSNKDVDTTSTDELEVVDEFESELLPTKIMLDIGHGGKDQGTANNYKNWVEKDVVLDIGLKLKSYLDKDKTIEVITSRTTDEFIGLEERNKISNSNNADMFISLHCNASEDTSMRIHGIETFYYSESTSKLLADTLHKKLIELSGSRDRGTKFGDYQVLRCAKSPAVLIELGFLTDIEEGVNLLNADYQDILAKALYLGIKEYIETIDVE